MADIRRSLGIRLSDNLQSAELVLVLEGEEDVAPIKALLSHYSTKLRAAFDSGRLGMDTLGGASKLVYKLGLLRSALCRYFAFIDHDQSGQDAVQKAKDAGLLTSADYSFVRCPGLSRMQCRYMPR